MAAFRLSREAATDIEAIVLYTHERWGAAQAIDYAEALFASCTRIAEMPGIGTVVEGHRGPLRRFRSGHHVLHYRVKDGVVEIVAFRHERSKAP